MQQHAREATWVLKTLIAAAVWFGCASEAREGSPPTAPQTKRVDAQFDPQGALLPPADYRNWVFLSSDFGMA